MPAAGLKRSHMTRIRWSFVACLTLIEELAEHLDAGHYRLHRRPQAPRIRQEFLEKPAHRPETGGIRRAKIDKENADLSRGTGLLLFAEKFEGIV